MVKRKYTITYKNGTVEEIDQLAQVEDHQEIAKIIEDCMKHDKNGVLRFGNPGYAIFIRMSEIAKFRIDLEEEIKTEITEIINSNGGDLH